MVNYSFEVCVDESPWDPKSGAVSSSMVLLGDAELHDEVRASTHPDGSLTPRSLLICRVVIPVQLIC